MYDGISGALSHDEFYQGAGAGGGWSATRGRAGVQSFALIERLKRYYGCGIWAGKLFCLCVIVDYLLYVILEICAPRSHIDICRNWPKKDLNDGKEMEVDVAKDESGISRKRSSRYRERNETSERRSRLRVHEHDQDTRKI